MPILGQVRWGWRGSLAGAADILGVLFVVALVAWIGVSAALNDQDVWLALVNHALPYAFLLVGFAAARILPSGPPMAVVAVAVAVTVSAAAFGDIGYRNAMAALVVQALALVLIAQTLSHVSPGGRRWLVAAALVCGVAILDLWSAAGIITGLLVLAARMVVIPSRPRHVAVLAAGAGAVLVTRRAGSARYRIEPRLVVAGVGAQPATARSVVGRA